MNITTLSLVALLAATMSAHASAQLFETRRVKRNRNTRLRDARRAQMRKLVDAMSTPTVTPAKKATDKPMSTPTVTPVDEPTVEPMGRPTKKPTKKPTSCEDSSHMKGDTIFTLSGHQVEYIGEGECKDASGNTFSYGELRESCDDFDECVKKCEEAGPAGWVGIQFTCGDEDEKDEGLCECLFDNSDTKSAPANQGNDAFKEVTIAPGTGKPVKTKSKARTFGLKARLNGSDGYIECGALKSSDGSAVGDYDTMDEWFAKEA